MKGRILITARAFWEHGAQAEAVLRENGFEVVRTPNPGPLPEMTLLPLLPSYDAVIASSDAYTAALFAASPQLKIVSRWGVGIDSVDLNGATQNGVVIINCPGSMTEPVADYTFALLLGISRRIVEGDALVRAGKWGELTGVLVCGKTLGLVGFGQIGQGVARRAAGFGMRILAYDPPLQQAGKDAVPSGLPAVEFVTLEELLAQSDFVSLHAPNLPETRQMFNADLFAQMKPTAYLINTARGALIDETALLSALQTGQIAGAALDVYSQEPLPPDHPLRQAPNCVLTPHNAFNALEAARATSMQTVDNVMRVWRGDHTAPVCNPAVWESPALRVK
jgi:phosphoglycerate dehydrogenase-like enzyme